MKKKIDYEAGSGNVFADIGLPNAEAHLVKAQLVYRIDRLMKARGLKQVAAAKLFGVKQPDVSKMLRGEFRQFSVERLMNFLVALGQDVDIVVKPNRGARSAPQLRVTDESADTERLKRTQREPRPRIRPQPSRKPNSVKEWLSEMGDQDSLTSNTKDQATSTELTGGSGFTYEDLVVAYYLSALLREERAAGQTGMVTSVAVQQSGHGHPMDDLIVEFSDEAGSRVLALQVKRQLRISAAKSNTDFREIVASCIATRGSTNFQQGLDAYGFVVENVAGDPFRSLTRLIEWAKASPMGEHFDARFAPGGSAAEAERALRDELKPLLGVKTLDEETSFFRHFVTLKFDGLGEGGLLRAEVVNRLQELVASNEDGQDILLFDRLCRIAREAAGKAQKWTRITLLNQLRGYVRLHVTPNYSHDIKALQAFSFSGLADVSETIDDFHVTRPNLQEVIHSRLAVHRLVNISGLPGCGKSAVLKHCATEAAIRGSILFIKADRLVGTTWATFAAALGLRHLSPAQILTEISAAGTTILFVDGIDRVRPDQKGVITDLLKTIEADDSFSHWKVLASSRDQGLEAYRAWFPTSFYRGSGIGDVSVKPFSDKEAETLAAQRPHLRRLLFGPPAVREIARRPFFAAVLARSVASDDATPQTEVDLIAAWWTRAGYDAPTESIPQRQRALLDLAEAGVRNLGKSISARQLKDSTFTQLAGLQSDLIIRDHQGAASYSFTHDIFFEWAFFRLLIDLGDEWHRAVIEAGEPPLLGRVIGLLAQNAIPVPGKWSAGFRALEGRALRAQWRREWLTAPPFSPAFANAREEFEALLLEDNSTLLQKLLVWFQAQHTVPSPVVLQRLEAPVEGIDNVRVADILGWPSDFETWGRLLDWLMPLSRTLSVRLVPHALEVFGVWQNALSDYENPRSAKIIDICSSWLIDLETSEYGDRPSLADNKWRELGREGPSHLASSLRTTILRSARAYPQFAIALFERAVVNKRMRESAYSDLMTFTPIMAEVAPDAVVAAAEAELMEELPQDKYDRNRREERERYDWLKRLRAIPEADRTEQQRRALEFPHFPIGEDRYDLDDIGIDSHNNFYFPPSALHEPFASLLEKRPEAGLRLIRDLSNHAVKGWRQVYDLNRGRMGTPLPVILQFPWGQRTFWGGSRVYSWFLGELAPHPLECAYLALGYWAFKKIDEGSSPSEIIKLILEGNECYAVLGLALVLALETYDVSEVTLPIAACQRLWHHDFARVVHEPTRNIDLLGFGFLSRLVGAKAQAKEYLDQRKSRSRVVRELAMLFALSADDTLRERFRMALAEFPNDLPYEIEEARTNLATTTRLKESAERWSGLGDSRNYRRQDAEDDKVLISFEPPTPLTAEQEQRLAQSTTSLREQSAIAWASKSLQENGLAEGWSLNDAIAFARERDHKEMFLERRDVGEHTAQSAISAIAACTIRFGQSSCADHDWAWDVMARIEYMAEPERFSRSKIPWHPTLHLIVALAHDRRSASPREDTAKRLFMLTAYPIDDVALLAFRVLFSDSDDHVRWVTAQLAMDYSIYHRPSIKDNGEHDDAKNRSARERSFVRALRNLESAIDTPLANVPPAWVKFSGTPRVRRSRGIRLGHLGPSAEFVEWIDADPLFNAQFAADVFPFFPIEAWSKSPLRRPMLQTFLTQLVTWTAQRLMPPWRDENTRIDRDTRLYEWNSCLGDLVARAVPFFDAGWVREHWLAPFLTDHEESLPILAAFADKSVTRHILDAGAIPSNTLPLLGDIVDRVVRDSTFDPDNYRAGEVHGSDMPTLVEALLFVSVEKAPGAARFVNGDWSQIALIMPIVTKLVSTTGWSPFVMQKFLTLCDRAGVSYPLDAFSDQANAVLSSIANAKGSWVGTTLPARMAAVVQRLADGNYPLSLTHAQDLLKVLDALIDLGDRRSAALEQTEAFRSVQGRLQ